MTRTEELLSMATAFRLNDDVTIEKRGDDAWCVVVGAGTCVNTALEREYEPLPSARDEDFILRTRFSLEDAFSLAEACQLPPPIQRVGRDSSRKEEPRE